MAALGVRKVTGVFEEDHKSVTELFIEQCQMGSRLKCTILDEPLSERCC